MHTEKNLKNFVLLSFIFLFLVSCQKTDLLKDVVFDNSLLSSVSINSENMEIDVSYESSVNQPFVDQNMKVSPSDRIAAWAKNNISNFGTMNKLVLDIIEASITQEEIKVERKIAGVVSEGNEYEYKINIILNFKLYNDDDAIIATTNVESYRSTTSIKFISLNEKEHILDQLTLDTLKDVSNKSLELLKIHMIDYVL